MYTIYIHRNKINNKAYIGQTCNDPKKRWENGSGYKKQPHFYSAINKYGWGNFEHIIWAENLTQDEANHLEELLIALFNTTDHDCGYNDRHGGNNSKLSEASKRQMSESHKGRFAGSNNPAARKVAQYDKNNNLIKVWDYARQASEVLGIQNTNISACCRGRLKTAGGFMWKYI